MRMGDVTLFEMPPPDMPRRCTRARRCDHLRRAVHGPIGDGRLRPGPVHDQGRLARVHLVRTGRQRAGDPRTAAARFSTSWTGSPRAANGSIGHGPPDAGGGVRRPALLPTGPELLRFVLSKPPDRVKYTHLRVLRKDFEEIEYLGMEAGILKGTAHFDDYADASFVRTRRSSNPTTGIATPCAAIQTRPGVVAPPAELVFPCRWRPSFSGWDLPVRCRQYFSRAHGGRSGIAELVRKGLLFKYIVASLFRVTWGFFGGPRRRAVGSVPGLVPAGLQAFNPMIQILRPISPIAWIPVAILWFGVSDAAPIFLIFSPASSRSRCPQWRRYRTCSRSTCGRRRNFGLGRISCSEE